MTTDVVLENEPQLALACSDDSSTESCDEGKPSNPSTSLLSPPPPSLAPLSNGGAAADGSAAVTSDCSLPPACIHLKRCVDFSAIKRALKTNGLENKVCSECTREATAPSNGERANDDSDEDSVLWLCLRCGEQLCWTGNAHARKHFDKPRSDPHWLFVNTVTFKVWCYKCDHIVDSTTRNKLIECINYLKKDAKKVNINLKQQQHQQVIPLPPPPPPQTSSSSSSAANGSIDYNDKGATTGLKQQQQQQVASYSRYIYPEKLSNQLEALPRVRGLSNLGNTCFFNAVLQCLAQTPYLSAVLKESSTTPGEYIQLPGGRLELQDDSAENDKNGETNASSKAPTKRYEDLPPINGNLIPFKVDSLTAALVDTIDELSSGGIGVFNPRKVLNQLSNKWPQFGDGDQHDSHEVLRHLLESVRNEDLRRYYTLILHALGYNTKVDPQTVQGDVKKKIQFYGQQASDRILRPEPVFRGFLVSTLTCQDCHHTSSRHEHFLDISLPVSAEKPQPPVRRKSSPEPGSSSMCTEQNLIALPMKGADEMVVVASGGGPSKCQLKKERKKEQKQKRIMRKQKMDKNGNNVVAVDGDQEQDEAAGGGDGDETLLLSNGQNLAMNGDNNDQDKDENNDPDDEDDGDKSSSNESKSDADIEDNCLEDDGSVSGRMMNLYIDQNEQQQQSVEKQDDTPENPNKIDFDAKNVVLEQGISEAGASNIVQQLEPEMTTTNDHRKGVAAAARKRQRTISHADWSTTIAPRYQCEDGECSVQSCLNNFTAIELMTGNNKVGCDACTERINGKDGKTINTNATKQFLVSSPPAVLILHLKRFQVGPRCMFRKLTKHVTFPFLLDIAPFCGTKVKNLPNVDRKQKKLLYSLYGIVEHSGGMHGGHYVAYVKVRPGMPKDDRRWKFIPQGSKAELDQTDEQRQRIEEALAKAREKMDSDSDDSSSMTTESSDEMQNEKEAGEEEGAVGGAANKEAADATTLDNEADNVVVSPPPGKWYYVSDSRVTEVSEDNVLKAQAYVLFYERIY